MDILIYINKYDKQILLYKYFINIIGCISHDILLLLLLLMDMMV